MKLTEKQKKITHTLERYHSGNISADLATDYLIEQGMDEDEAAALLDEQDGNGDLVEE